MKKYYRIIIPILFVLALALGFIQNRQDKTFSFGQTNRITYFKNPSSDSLEGYYNKSQEIVKKADNNKRTLSFLAVGDIMLSRSVALAIEKSTDPELPFTNTSNLLKQTDFNFGNLESPISGNDFYNKTGSLVFNAPQKYAKKLLNYNFLALNLANNHSLDQGEEGLQYTINFLDKLNIKHTGTGTTLNEAWQPAIVEKNGLRIAFLGASYASTNDGGKINNQFVARIEDTENLKHEIEILKKQVDFIVVTMHAGTEYTKIPNSSQTHFARQAIDLGADMVIGAHPHWVQTIEHYKGKYIFYSLGNFIFDQEWSRETKEGLTIKVQISQMGGNSQNNLQGQKTQTHLDSIELIPVIIENYSTPRLATPEESTTILKKIGEKNTILY